MARTTEEREVPVREEPELHPAPPVDMRRAVRLGLVGGLTAAFVSAIGMVQQFDSRPVVDGVTLGHIVLVGIPALFGYLAGSPPKQLEGFAPSERGTRNVLAGALAGLLTGVLSAVFAAVVPPELRAGFPHISPALVDPLRVGLGAAVGSVVVAVIGLVAGSGGAAMHLMTDRWRKALLWALLWVGIFG